MHFPEKPPLKRKKAGEITEKVVSPLSIFAYSFKRPFAPSNATVIPVIHLFRVSQDEMPLSSLPSFMVAPGQLAARL